MRKLRSKARFKSPLVFKYKIAATLRITINNGNLTSFIARGGGELLPVMAFTGKVRPKGVPFSRCRYIKG